MLHNKHEFYWFGHAKFFVAVVTIMPTVSAALISLWVVLRHQLSCITPVHGIKAGADIQYC